MMKNIELSKDEICYLADILNEKISGYTEEMYHDAEGKPFSMMPDGTVSYNSYEIEELPIANSILEKI